MNRKFKEVYFIQYCSLCEYFKLEEDESPCCDCLKEAVNLYSHKPIKFTESTTSKSNINKV